MEEYKQLTKNMVHRTLGNGASDEILELLQNNIDVNHVNEDGDTALHAILRNEKLIEKHVVEISTVLLSQGANPNIANKREQTSLHLAVERGMKDVVDLLLKFEANVHAANEVGDTIAHFFIEDEYQKCKLAMLYPIMNTEENRVIKERRSVSFLEFLISKDVDFDRQNKDGISALYSAIMYQLLHILPTLFKHTKDIKFVEKNKTLLHYFLDERSLSLPNERPQFNYNPEYATRCVNVLLERRLPILECVKYGCTLISKAIKKKEETGIIEALISYYLNNCDTAKVATTLHNELTNTSNSWSASQTEYFMIVLSDLETRIADLKNKMPQNRFAIAKADIDKRVDEMRTPLHEAVMLNEPTETIESLLANGADMNAADSAGKTPLHLAVSLNNEAIVELLLEHGASVDRKSNIQLTPLHFVQWKTDEALKIVKLLLMKGADVNARDSTKESPISLAVKNNNVAIVRLFLQNGALINCQSNSFRLTTLHRALKSETVSVQMVELLLQSGAETNTKDYKGETPLHSAVFKNNPSVVRLLLEYGAFVACRNKSGQTPLHCAVSDGSLDIVELLLVDGVNARDRNGDTPLYTAVSRNDLQIVRLLVDYGAFVGCRNNRGRAPLHCAVSNDAADIVELLLAHGADPNVRDDEGNAPLHEVTNWSSRDKRVLKMMLENGARVDLPNNRGQTAASYAWSAIDYHDNCLRNYCDSRIEYLEDPRRKRVYENRDEYVKEIEELQSIWVGKDKSLFDFLRMHPKRRCCYMRNEELQRLVESPNIIREQYPVYHCVIMARYRETVMRKSLEESARDALYEMVGVQLSHVVDEIFAQLENEDLVNVTHANLL